MPGRLRSTRKRFAAAPRHRAFQYPSASVSDDAGALKSMRDRTDARTLNTEHFRQKLLRERQVVASGKVACPQIASRRTVLRCDARPCMRSTVEAKRTVSAGLPSMAPAGIERARPSLRCQRPTYGRQQGKRRLRNRLQWLCTDRKLPMSGTRHSRPVLPAYAEVFLQRLP